MEEALMGEVILELDGRIQEDRPLVVNHQMRLIAQFHPVFFRSRSGHAGALHTTYRKVHLVWRGT